MVWGEDTFARQPSLDGVRGVAVAFVVAFHLGLPWATGGYLGVSVFFTLSGFLITSLLLHEHARSRRIDIKAFYLRRARRLLPAALLCIGGVIALMAFGWLPQREGATGEVFSATFDAANWHALLAGESYANLFTAPSALAHFWSLAIEEQFYLLWPIAFAAMAAFAARRRGPASLSRGILALFIVCAVSAPMTAHWWSADAAYYASWARFGEILAGALLASVLFRRKLPDRIAVLAPVCLSAIVIFSVLSPSGTGWAYGGGLPLFATLSAGLIAGLQVPGRVRTLLAARPLVELGAISYGVYLIHWPVFVVLDSERTGWTGTPLVAVRLFVTLALARGMYAVVERPIRTRVLLTRQSRFLVSVSTGLIAVAVTAALLVPDLDSRRHHQGPVLLAADGAASTYAGSADRAATAAVANLNEEVTTKASSVTGPAPPPPLPPSLSSLPSRPEPSVVAVLGDSVPAWLLADAAPSFNRTDVVVVNAAYEGCDGAVNEPMAQGPRGERLSRKPSCEPWPDEYPSVVEGGTAVDVALLMIGEAPMLSHRFNGQWVDPCTDMRWYTSDVAARIDYLKAHVGRVVVTLPAWQGRNSNWYYPDDHEDRLACVRDQLARTALNAGATTIDLARVLCPSGRDTECPSFRERDGLHVDPEDAPMVLGWILDHVGVGRRAAPTAGPSA